MVLGKGQRMSARQCSPLIDGLQEKIQTQNPTANTQTRRWKHSPNTSKGCMEEGASVVDGGDLRIWLACSLKHNRETNREAQKETTVAPLLAACIRTEREKGEGSVELWRSRRGARSLCQMPERIAGVLRAGERHDPSYTLDSLSHCLGEWITAGKSSCRMPGRTLWQGFGVGEKLSSTRAWQRRRKQGELCKRKTHI